MWIPWAAAAIPIAFCLFCFWLSRRLNKEQNKERESAISLAVLSGLLAALAILIPLGAALLPPSRAFQWREGLLLGALFVCVVCMFGTIYSMVQLQDGKTFVPKNKLYIPAWTNTAWIALVALAFCVVLLKVVPSAEVMGASSATAATDARYAVARNLPKFRTSKQEIEKYWGAPRIANENGLLYTTTGGVVVFCMDNEGLLRVIVETIETKTDAIGTHCRTT
ncbi:MAG TPA: hypothetical protein VNJ09_07440 [Chthonomonadales bacterium]|nr:hypothetical protein [Chthonomonadales bacterium]